MFSGALVVCLLIILMLSFFFPFRLLCYERNFNFGQVAQSQDESPKFHIALPDASLFKDVS
jgi:hypothetical protein